MFLMPFLIIRILKQKNNGRHSVLWHLKMIMKIMIM